MLLKPGKQTPLNQKVKRLPKRNGMTLAIGMLCEEGIILAADSRLSYDDDSIQDCVKVAGFLSSTGTFVVVHSSEDANAADSLVAEIKLRIEKSDPKTFEELQGAVKSALQRWYVPVHDDRPTMQLLLGASMQQEKERAMFYCEPPNTVKRVWDHYKAIGAGWRISDPIYERFRSDSVPSAHSCLCQISYMMYRAKKLIPRSVGGSTDVGFITEPSTVPYWIERVSMASAEAYGLALDRNVAKLASLVMCGSLKGHEDVLKAAQDIYQMSFMYAAAVFRCQFPDKLIRRQFNT
jgi:hypothetical protein